MNALTDYEIIEICKEMNIPLNGIYFKDSLKNLKNGFYIINLMSKDDSRNGTHWTAFYYNESEKYPTLYYDSFGFVPPKETEKIIKPYIYNDKDIQNINSSSCGYYCIAFIKFLHRLRNKIKAYQTFINMFDEDTRKNESILYSILYGK